MTRPALIAICVADLCLAPGVRLEHSGEALVRLARGTNLVDRAQATGVAELSASPRTNQTVVRPASIMPPTNAPTRAFVSKAVIPTPTTRVWAWTVPAWPLYNFMAVTRSNASEVLFPCTWLERVTAIGATNWTQCSSNVPIATTEAHQASAVVTNLPVYYVRPVYGWRVLP